ncbi:kelch repeat-containing protein [Corallococcus llansteffanensis]|uniref:HYR domain-containing protein n=1 Tax=Corallococcus llansteffanensis TaxID=2316731 RepID=A0A3A8QCB7_9BACT|nr:kelch repeat-containing protein [Corallococcus llansteffanensis]RKH66256.1 HYR domain-containing protein [Corallococcus llansteffanensis]
MRSQHAVWSRILVLVAGVSLLACSSKEHPTPGDGAPSSAKTPLAAAPGWAPTVSMARTRAQHGAVLLPSGELLVINGVNRTGFVREAELYNPATGTWRDAGDSGIQGNVTEAVLLPNGKVLALTDGSTSGRLYDPATGTWTATGNMAQTRGLPTITLLNSGQVLVAGGTGSGGVRLTSAELYDPASNTFLPTGAMTLGRGAHSATLLRNGQVLAVSGFNQAGEVPGADRYDPTTGTWSATAPVLVPRHYSTSTLLPDGRVLVAGGFTAGGVTTASEIYDPATNTWTATGSLAFARSGHSATLLPDGRVLASGGSDSARNPQVVSEVYNPATGQWTPAGSMNIGRENHTATLLPSGKVLVAGGYSSAPSLTFYAETELYDPAVSRWSPAGALGTPRTDPVVALLPTGKVLVAGGRTGSGASSTAVELYDRTTNAWASALALATPRERATATVLPSGQVLVAGGRNGSTSVTAAERYDAASNTWTPVASLTTPRHVHTATLLPDGTVLVVGGQRNLTVLSAVERYTPGNNTWTPVASAAIPRAAHATVLLPDGRVLIVGGHDNTGAPLASAELYDPATNTWAPAAGLAQAREELTLTLLPSGQVLATGGLAGVTELASAELYDPGTNTWTGVGPLAQERWHHTATLMPSGKVLVAGGLTFASAFSDVAEVYDPITRVWSTVNAPASRGGLVSVALPSGEVLLAGGDDTRNSELFDDTGALPAWRPVVTRPATLVPACPTVLEGLLFRGISGASGGTSTGDSPTDFPLVRLQAAEGGRLLTLPSSDTSSTRATVTVPVSVPLGTYALTVFANAIPGGRMVQVVANQTPTAINQDVAAGLDTPLAVTLTATDPDVGQVLTWTVVRQPLHGTLSGTPPNLTYTPAPGYVGADSFDFRVRDCVQDSNLGTVNITVTAGPPPTLTCPADVTAEATGPDGAVVTYDPAVPGQVGTPVSYSVPSGSRFPLGATTVTATTAGGVPASCSFVVTVRDTTPPSVTCPSDQTATTDGAGAQVSFEPTATDAVTATPTVTSSPASGSVFAPGSTRVTVTATDEAGNSAQCTFQVAVQAAVVSIAGGGCQSAGGDATSALALLAGLASWAGLRRRRTSPGVR